MKLMDILRKLGIISCQAKATVYTKGKDRPLEFIDDPDNNSGPSLSKNTSTEEGE